MSVWSVHILLPVWREFAAQAQKNKWASPWLKYWFYWKLGVGKGVGTEFCGELTSLATKAADGAVTEVACGVVAALCLLGCHLCARELFEEMMCAKVVPPCVSEEWFAVSGINMRGKG